MTIKIDKFKVEKGVPIPGFYNGRALSSVFPLVEMEIGDSFLIPKDAELPSKVLRSRVLSNASTLRRTKGWQFTTRVVDEGVRVWRIQDKDSNTPERLSELAKANIAAGQHLRWEKFREAKLKKTKKAK